MQIDNPDALKAWLTHILEPLCDADPAALARYVLALLKKDKAVRELSQCMSEQLEVFLAAETAPFLARLFDAIASEEYLKFQAPAAGGAAAATAASSDPAAIAMDGGGDATAAIVASLDATSSASDSFNATAAVSHHQSSATSAAATATTTSSVDHAAAAGAAAGSLVLLETAAASAFGEYAQQPGELAVPNQHDLLIEHASPMNSPVRSPIKGGGSGALSEAANNSATAVGHQQQQQQHQHHHKPASSSESTRRRRISVRSRSRSRSRSFERTSRDRGGARDKSSGGTRSYGSGASGTDGRNKSPGGRTVYDRRANRGAWKSRSRSPIERSRGANAKQPQQQQQSTTVYSVDDALIEPSIKSAVIVSQQQQQQQRQRCRDFDEKGYCMRGETCPWDHGVDPVVLEDINNPAALMSGVGGARSGAVGVVGVTAGNAEYSPDEPELWTRSAAAAGGPFGRGGGNAGGGGGAGGSSHRGGSGYNRGGNSAAGGNAAASFRGGNGNNNGQQQHHHQQQQQHQFPFFALNAPNSGTTPLQRELIAVPVLEAAAAGGGGGNAHHNNAHHQHHSQQQQLHHHQQQQQQHHHLHYQQQQQHHGGDINAPGLPKRRYDPEDTVAVAEQPGLSVNTLVGPPLKRKMPISGRLGPRVSHHQHQLQQHGGGHHGGPGGGGGGHQQQQQNCSLELRKVPRGLNSIAHLNNHFSKFGKIVNIQISYDGDAEAAIVTFSTHAEANVAYRSTEAVLNNRFIKVFWHTAPVGDATGVGRSATELTDGQQQPQQQHHHLRHKIGAPNQYSLNNTTNNSSNGHTASVPTAEAGTEAAAATTAAQAIANSNTTTTTTTPSSSSSASTATTATTTSASAANSALGEAVQRSRANNRINRVLQQQQPATGKQQATAAAVQLAQGLHERKHELLQGYLKQLRCVVELVERTDHADGQRAQLLGTIATLQAAIDKLNKEIAGDQVRLMQQPNAAAAAAATAGAQQQHQHHQHGANAAAAAAAAAAEKMAAMRRTKELHKKELLDIELELFAQQQEGNDTTQLQRRIEELQRSLGGSVPAAITTTTTLTAAAAAVLSGKSSAAATAAAAAGGKVTASGKHLHSHHLQQQHGGGGGGKIARVRPAPPGSTSVDRRPTTLRITGFEAVDSDVLLGHFKLFGEVTRTELDKEVPALIVAFTTRINAEQAMLRGRTFKERQLQISWVSNPCVVPSAASAAAVAAAAASSAAKNAATVDGNNTIHASKPADTNADKSGPNDEATDNSSSAKATDAIGHTTTTATPADRSNGSSDAATAAVAADGSDQQHAGDSNTAASAEATAAKPTSGEAAAAGAAAGGNTEEVVLEEDDEEEEDGDEDRSWRR